jgi:hypothetical protein
MSYEEKWLSLKKVLATYCLNQMKFISQVDYDNLYNAMTSFMLLIECKANNFHFFRYEVSRWNACDYYIMMIST